MSTSVPPATDESVFQHVSRVCKNSFTKCFGFAQTADELAKIKYKEYLIDSRKKAFGVAYFQLLQDNATPEALKSCVDVAMADVAKIMAEIVVLQEEIDRVNNDTKEKVLPKPGAAAPPAAAAAETAVPPVSTSATATTSNTEVSPTPAPVETIANKPDEVDMQEVSLEATPTTKP